jgi:hypothetical protein|tara:strand:+ start:173 stop:418 length:246 start_codon:yes stop_codon:yes gene_type:complete
MTKVTNDELVEIQTVTRSEQTTATNLGFIEYELKRLQDSKEELLLKIKQLQEMRGSKLEELNQKYGAGQLNIDTGEFTPTK